MNYQKIYSAFIADRRTTEDTTRLLDAYTESHHVLPRALGGDDSSANLIRLTPEDHFFAHLLLAKIHGGKMWQALMIMSRRPKGRSECERFARRSRRHYGMAKREAAAVYAEDYHKRLAEGRGPMSTPEARAKVSVALKGRVFSEEHRQRISSTKKGVQRSEESIAKQKTTITGVKRSAAHSAAISAALKGRKKSPEHIEKMRANATGKVVGDATRAKRREQCLQKADPAFFRGRVHSPDTKARMAAVYAAKRKYQKIFGISPRIVTIEMITAAGIKIAC